MQKLDTVNQKVTEQFLILAENRKNLKPLDDHKGDIKETVAAKHQWSLLAQYDYLWWKDRNKTFKLTWVVL